MFKRKFDSVLKQSKSGGSLLVANQDQEYKLPKFGEQTSAFAPLRVELTLNKNEKDEREKVLSPD